MEVVCDAKGNRDYVMMAFLAGIDNLDKEDPIDFDVYMKPFLRWDEDELKACIWDAFMKFTVPSEVDPNKRSWLMVEMFKAIDKDIGVKAAVYMEELLWWFFENKEDFYLEKLMENV